MTDDQYRMHTPDETEHRARAFAQLAAASSAVAEAVRKTTDEEVAKMQLVAIAQPSLLPILAMEARRRAAVMAEIIEQTPWPGPIGETTLAAALRSVAADIAARRLP